MNGMLAHTRFIQYFWPRAHMMIGKDKQTKGKGYGSAGLYNSVCMHIPYPLAIRVGRNGNPYPPCNIIKINTNPVSTPSNRAKASLFTLLLLMAITVVPNQCPFVVCVWKD